MKSRGPDMSAFSAGSHVACHGGIAAGHAEGRPFHRAAPSLAGLSAFQPIRSTETSCGSAADPAVLPRQSGAPRFFATKAELARVVHDLIDRSCPGLSITVLRRRSSALAGGCTREKGMKNAIARWFGQPCRGRGGIPRFAQTAPLTRSSLRR
jgi:hypothetical protein